ADGRRPARRLQPPQPELVLARVVPGPRPRLPRGQRLRPARGRAHAAGQLRADLPGPGRALVLAAQPAGGTTADPGPRRPAHGPSSRGRRWLPEPQAVATLRHALQEQNLL